MGYLNGVVEPSDGRCVAVDYKYGSREKYYCRVSPVVPGSRYCETHQGRGTGVNELKYAETSSARNMVVPAPQESHIYDKVEAMVERVLEFEDDARQAYKQLDPEDRRFVDSNGSEQLRAEVTVYERALDRSARVLREVTKLGIESQIVRINQEQMELMKNAVNATLVSLGLSRQEMNRARKLIAEKLREYDMDPVETRNQESNVLKLEKSKKSGTDEDST